MTFAGVVCEAIHRAETRSAETAPDRVVVSDGSASWTGATLLAAVALVADELRDRTSSGRRVLLLLPSGAPLVAAFLACGETSVTPLILDASSSDRVVDDIVSRMRPVAILTDSEGVTRLGNGRFTASDGHRVPVPIVDVRSPLEHLSAARSSPPRAAVRNGSPALEEFEPVAAVSPTFAILTSGTTGSPKGVRRTHASWLRSFAATRPVGPGAGDRLVVPGSLASSWFLYSAIEGLCSGATIRLWDHVEPAAIVDEVDSWGATHLTVVPTLLDACVTSARRRGMFLPSLRRITSCGGIWPAGLRDRVTEVAPNAQVGEVYGAAEWSVVSLREIQDDSMSGDLGRPVPGVEVSVRDEHDQPVADAGTGVLWVRSPLLFDGYVDEAESGSASRDDVSRDGDGFVAVGDMVRYVDGRLHLLGRRDHVLISRGSKVHPEPIEAALRELAEVADAAVTLASDDRRGEHLVALVQRAAGVTSGRLRVHMRRQLPRQSRPARFLLVTELPRTAAGKLDRCQLPGLAASSAPIPSAWVDGAGRR